MSKHDSAPTHSWVIASHVNRLVVRLSLVLLVGLGVLVFYVVSQLNHDCSQPVALPAQVFHYKLNLIVTSTDIDCPTPAMTIPDFTVYP
jgi:hypothetical protein